MSLLNLVQQHISAEDVQSISQELGADPDTTQKAIEAALPLMVGGMAHTAHQPDGSDAIAQALGAFSAGGAESPQAFGGLSDLLRGGAAGGGIGGILGSILGHHESTVQDGVQHASGLDRGKSGKLLILLAPFLIRALAKRQAASNTQPGGVMADDLHKDATTAMETSNSPHIGGILGKILGSLAR